MSLANKKCHPTYYIEYNNSGKPFLKIREKDGLTFREQLVLNLASNPNLYYKLQMQ